jgi:hypothetical protein
MKITLGGKELENIVGAWATDRYDAGIPSVKIVKRRDSIDVVIDYTDAREQDSLINQVSSDIEAYDEIESVPSDEKEESQA